MFLASMSPRILLFAACLSCLQLCCLAQDVQARAEAMLQRARQLSDIRSPSAPAFRLKATFSFVGDDLATVQGTYTEIRVSQSQWRREIVVGDLRQVDIGGVGKHWILHPDGFPSHAQKRAAGCRREGLAAEDFLGLFDRYLQIRHLGRVDQLLELRVEIGIFCQSVLVSIDLVEGYTIPRRTDDQSMFCVDDVVARHKCGKPRLAGRSSTLSGPSSYHLPVILA